MGLKRAGSLSLGSDFKLKQSQAAFEVDESIPCLPLGLCVSLPSLERNIRSRTHA